ncbi:Factor arrest protein 11 [Malassezia vespertilionis]|uniref:Far11p n=1 Tax=Malassezia vespertilionis TaxID=2020962 RepID=A0A2N1JBR4_9BASI|nr:Factor arrest protein 11 [Malassezia vespertilionis]PKI83962.1 Far11p [Malassezia vespertilionis]WFD06616.1 Factor arrest protein 11 [Malassezia vespertilionis]
MGPTEGDGGLGARADAQGAAHDVPADFEYTFDVEQDTDCVENELDEFYAYVEAPLFVENYERWMAWCTQKWAQLNVRTQDGQSAEPGAWAALAPRTRRQILQRLVSSLDLSDASSRLDASRALLYHLQGSYNAACSEAEQLQWIKENAGTVFDLGGVDDIYAALKRACWKFGWFSALPDYMPGQEEGKEPLLTPNVKTEYLEEINVEITICFALLYSILQVMHGNFDLSDALMALDPPLPVYMYTLVANLREKSIKGFPVKKMVLLLWKSLLATLGGAGDIARCKRLARERDGLGAMQKTEQRTPATPDDIRLFRQELSAKYPTLVLPHGMRRIVGAEQLAQATQPLPMAHEKPDKDMVLPEMHNTERTAFTLNTQMRTNKQKFQTDQRRPFVLPYSAQMHQGTTVPESIQEALGLFQEHLHIDTAVWQTCTVREEYLARLQGAEDVPGCAEAQKERGRAKATQALDTILAEMHLSSSPSSATAQRAQDTKRLQWVDTLYGAILPELQSAVIVLLKLILATTTSGGTNSAYTRAVAEGVPSEKAPDPTLEDMDIVRHREIFNKGISSVLLLTLRWFKASHALKYEYLAQVMLDSNVLLLILKIFGLQEVSQFVRWRSEVPEFGMFSFCRMVHVDNVPPASPHDILANATLRLGDVWSEYKDVDRITHGQSIAGPHPHETAYSWRNFATTFRLTQILHKVTKRKVHRILLLVQYKSSAILKRTLKIKHRRLHQYVLRLIKSQVPYCGRKWRQSNMRTITQIYLLCKPVLRDDWLGSGDVDAEIDSSLPAEQTLRTLIQFYNQAYFSVRTSIAGASGIAEEAESSALAADAAAKQSARTERTLGAGHDSASVIFERDAFPLRSHAGASSTPGRYISAIPLEGYLDAYEDVFSEMFGEIGDALDMLTQESPLSHGQDDGTDNAQGDGGSDGAMHGDENCNNWEHMSPREMQLLLSPSGERVHSRPSSRSNSMSHERRVNSNPAQGRPLLHWNMEDLVEDAIENSEATAARPATPLQPVPAAPRTPPQPGGIDEVEHLFGA